MKKYQIELSEEQLTIILIALESYMRLGLGQLEIVLSDNVLHRPFPESCNYGDVFHDEEIRDAIVALKKIYFGLNNMNGSYGICNGLVHEKTKISYEMFCKIRQFLVLKRQPNGGTTKDFDEPLKLTGRDHINIKQIEDGVDDKS